MYFSKLNKYQLEKMNLALTITEFKDNFVFVYWEIKYLTIIKTVHWCLPDN